MRKNTLINLTLLNDSGEPMEEMLTTPQELEEMAALIEKELKEHRGKMPEEEAKRREHTLHVMKGFLKR